jgi:DNA-binding PadR family transcriptional regulator
MMTNAELTILGLIAEESRHGYDIEQIIEKRGMRGWTEIGFSSIYYLLNKLEKDGMVSSQLQQLGGKGPARKVYSITADGKNALTAGALAAISTPRNGSKPFLLGLSNLPIIPPENLLPALNSYAAYLDESLKHLEERAEQQRPLAPFVEAMFDYSQVLIEAELNWLRKFILEVEAGRV